MIAVGGGAANWAGAVGDEVVWWHGLAGDWAGAVGDEVAWWCGLAGDWAISNQEKFV